MQYHIFCKETHKYLCTYTNAESLNTLDTTRCYYKEETVLIAYANDSNPLANKYRTTDNNYVSRSSRNKSNSSSQSSNSSNSGYSSFLAEVNDLAKLNKSSGEQLVTQMENEPLRKIPRLSDNKKFLGRLRATRRYIDSVDNSHHSVINSTSVDNSYHARAYSHTASDSCSSDSSSSDSSSSCDYGSY